MKTRLMSFFVCGTRRTLTKNDLPNNPLVDKVGTNLGYILKKIVSCLRSECFSFSGLKTDLTFNN